jgi:chemotaxis protein methyltransferase CheR
MLLAKHLPAENGWDAQVVATDISTRVLEKAQKGIYDAARSGEIPEELLRKFMLRGIAGRQGQMKAKVEIQQMVEFKRLNLNHESYEVGSPFDVILCRNVLIYFDADSKRKVVARLINHLAADGLLFVGHAENLTSISGQLRSVEPTIYARKEAALAGETSLAKASSSASLS